MDVATALLHVLDFLVAPAATAALSAALMKLIWRRNLQGTRWWSLAAPASAASALVLLVGLVTTGHDGRMATWALMVLACAATLGWIGFGPRRR